MKFFPLHSEYIAQWHFASVFSHVSVALKWKAFIVPESVLMPVSSQQHYIYLLPTGSCNLMIFLPIISMAMPLSRGSQTQKDWPQLGKDDDQEEVYMIKKKRSLIFSWRNWIRRAFTPWCAIPSRNNPGIFLKSRFYYIKFSKHLI